jgi:hypothetical protein
MTTYDDVLSQLQPEEVPLEVNINAPDPGARPPAIKPTNNVPFRFVLNAEKPTELIRDGRHVQINFTAVIDVPKADGGTYEKEVRFQKADTFKGDWMDNCSAFDLIRSMHLERAFHENMASCGDARKAIVATLLAADGMIGRADFGWTARFSESQLTYRTGQAKRYTNKGGWTTDAWPRNADGTYTDTVSDPATGEEKYPNLEVIRFRIVKQSPVAVGV